MSLVNSTLSCTATSVSKVVNQPQRKLAVTGTSVASLVKTPQRILKATSGSSVATLATKILSKTFVAVITSIVSKIQNAVAPVVVGVSATGLVITLEFDRELSINTPSNAQFTITGSGTSISSVSAGGYFAYIVMAANMTNGATLGISYTPGGGTRLRGNRGIDVAAFSGLAATVVNPTDTPVSFVHSGFNDVV